MKTSILVPVYNEEESLRLFYAELFSVLIDKKDIEIIFIDDGSTDNSLNILKEILKRDTRVKIYSFRKNLGKAEALTFGFQKTNGDYIVTLDADLQDRPDQIQKMLKMAKQGNDLVCGWRKNRRDSILKKISSKSFNFLAGVFWGLHLHDYNCGLKVYSKEAARTLDLYGGLYRFIPLFVYQKGFKICEIPVTHEKRKYGKSKYGFSKLWKDIPDMFTMLFLSKYSEKPLHFFGFFGIMLLMVGVLILIYLSILHSMGTGISDRPLFFLGILLILSGFQVFFTGFLADLFINVSHRKEKEILLKYSSKD